MHKLRRLCGLGDTAIVEDLRPKTKERPAGLDWAALRRDRWEGSATDWNHMKRAVGKFLTDHLGDRFDPLRREIVKGIKKEYEKPREETLSPETWWHVINAAAEHVRASYVTITLLALMPSEYLRLEPDHLDDVNQRVKVPGSKTVFRATALPVDARMWRWITAGVPSPVGIKWLRIYWRRALTAAGQDPDFRLYDLRHLPAQWLTDHGLSEARVSKFMRHGDPTMTRRYAGQRDKQVAATTLADIVAIGAA
jgi:hypothetical protein